MMSNEPLEWRASRANLASSRTAMDGRGRLLVVEVIVRIQRGGKVQDVTILVRTGGRNRTEQEYHGTWFVRSRAVVFQPYVDAGFPHGTDQFISTAATAWAVMALAGAL